MSDESQAPVGPHKHVPVIVHRTGGRDARFYNACGVCGEQIERADETEPWATADEVEAYAQEQHREAALEAQGAYDPDPAPPRE